MERRRSRRFPVSGIEATLTCAYWAEAHHALLDLSLTGAFVATEHLPELGQHVALALQGPCVPGRLLLMGHVVAQVGAVEAAHRGHSPGIGVAFETPPPEVARYLARVLESLEGPHPLLARVPSVAPVPLPAAPDMARAVSALAREVSMLRARVKSLEHENSVLSRGVVPAWRMAMPPPPPVEA